VTSIACILLVGMVMKNAIMMVDFALEAERSRQLNARDAIREAARLRARPITMTMLAAIFSAVPIAIGTGPGLRTAPAARHRHRRRLDRGAVVHALHNAGDLSHHG